MSKSQNTPYNTVGHDPIVRFKDVEKVIGCGRTTAYSYIKQGIMPAPIKLGPRACGWRLSTLRAWLSAREAMEAV